MKNNGIGITIKTEAAISTLRNEFKDLSKAQQNKALARTINEVISKAKVHAAKEMKLKYNTSSKNIKATMRLSKANSKRFLAQIRISGKPLPLIAFSARKTRKGVSVKVMGNRRIIRSAFIATMGSGHTGVFARGKYVNRVFQFRDSKRLKPRGNDLPIDELVSMSPFGMITSNSVSGSVADKMERDFSPVFLKQLLTVRRGY